MQDEDAWFRGVYQRCHPLVLAYAHRRAGPDQAREATDETFLVAWRRRAELPDPPLPWLIVTARNILAQQRRRGLRTDAIALALAAAPVHEPGVAEEVLERITVLRAVSELSEADRELVMLTGWDGLTASDTARVLGCSTATLHVRLHRARRRLAAALDRVDRPVRARPAPQHRPTPTREDQP